MGSGAGRQARRRTTGGAGDRDAPNASARAVESLIRETRRRLAASGGEIAAGTRNGDATANPMFGSIVGLAAEIALSSGLESQLRALIEEAPAAIFLKDRELRYVFANRRAAALAGVSDPEILIGHTDAEFLPAESAAEIMAGDRKILDGGPPLDEEAVNHLPTGDAILHAQVFAIPDQTGRLAWLAGVVSDVTERRQAETALAHSERRYRMLFEQAHEGIVLVDQDGRFVDANPAACVITGRPRADIVGKHVSELVVEGTSVWEAFRASTGEAGVVRGDVEFERPDGGHVTVEYAASPFTTDGLNVAILRDVTERRRRELGTRARLEVTAAIRSIPATAEDLEVAASVDRAFVELGGFIGAGILTFAGRGEIRLLHSQIRAEGEPVDISSLLPPEVMRRTRRRIRSGPFVEAWTDRQAAAVGIAGLGIGSSACFPLEWHGEILGMLALASGDKPEQLERRLPDLTEIADAVATRLGPGLAAHATMHVDRRMVRRIIHRRAFRPVFQPIVDLMSREAVGYEGLTRFADGAPPDQTFAIARRAGLGVELEIATLEAILEASGPLPANRYLSVNVSPAVILAGTALRGLLRDAGFNVVLEITEHDQVNDYPALVAAIADLGDHVTIAVDDAGSGFASLRHIVELRPAYVKLDRGLIAGIDRDVARQAMVAGLREFAARLDVTLVAEGVEREAEWATLLGLDLRRGQGYLFGRPAPVDEALVALRSAPALRRSEPEPA
jgi:PAS domain S-box-containing protein